MTAFVPVVDIAYYQGDVDFGRLRDAGVGGVIARASDGWRTGEDPRWYEYARGTTAAGLPLGSYWYQRPLDGNEGPEEQARRWISYVEKAGVDVRFLMLDLEWYWAPEYPGPLPKRENALWTRRHVAELRKLWSKPIIAYTSGNYWNAYLDDPLLAAELDFLLARYHYGNRPPPSDPALWSEWALANPKRPTVPAGSGPWEGWQFSSSLYGPDVGIEATRVDACIVRADAWQRWTNEVAVLPPEPPTPEPPTPIPPTPEEGLVTVNVTLKKLSTKTPKNDLSVKKWQSLINAVTGRGLAEDGHFGPKTEAATRDFQAFFGLTVDGWVGSESWKAILDLR